MIENRHGGTIWESPSFKLLVAIVIILAFVAIFFIQRKLGQTSGVSGTDIKPKQGNSTGATRLPAPENPDASNPQYPLDSWTNHENPASKMSGQTTTQSLPADPALSPKTETHPLSAPITQVHPLSEAEEVMGAPSSEVGQVGVTRTYKLPDQNSPSKTNPLPKKEKQP
jgi:hypothetical protein